MINLRRHPLPPLVLMLLATILSGCIAGFGLHYTPDDQLYGEPPHNAITFWGHAAMYIDIDGYGIITDPVFEPVYAAVHRRFIKSPPEASFDQTRVVLISHPHNDHLSAKTLKRFSDSTVILCPTRSAKYMDELGQKIITMRPGDVYEFDGGEIIAVAAYHPGYRYSFKAKGDGRALGYVIRTPQRTLYYTGDSDYFEVFQEVGTAYQPDVMLLNLNTHLKSQDALRAIADVNPTTVVPGHFGAYRGSNERKTPKYRKELAELLGSMWVELAVGESCDLNGRPLSGR
jgi:L-ascorbate metabolism protein UlaG (beta-lactamase superfamily)